MADDVFIHWHLRRRRRGVLGRDNGTFLAIVIKACLLLGTGGMRCTRGGRILLRAAPAGLMRGIGAARLMPSGLSLQLHTGGSTSSNTDSSVVSRRVSMVSSPCPLAGGSVFLDRSSAVAKRQRGSHWWLKGGGGGGNRFGILIRQQRPSPVRNERS